MKNRIAILSLSALLVGTMCAQTKDSTPLAATKKDDGYRGIWFTLGQKSEYGDKYSGGLGTYTANHVPMAIYAKEANKTFFVYGGSKEGKSYLYNMIGCYDHATR